MTIVFQSFPTQKKTSNPLLLLLWSSPLTLSSLSYLPYLLLPKYLLIQLRLTRHPSHLHGTDNPSTVLPDAASSPPTGLQFSISLPQNDQPKPTDEFLTFSSFLSEVRLFLSRPNNLKLQPDHSALVRQHRREYYTNHARRTKRPRFNQYLQYCLKPEFCNWEIIFWHSKRQEYTIQSTSLPSQRLVVPPQTITAIPRWCR